MEERRALGFGINGGPGIRFAPGLWVELDEREAEVEGVEEAAPTLTFLEEELEELPPEVIGLELLARLAELPNFTEVFCGSISEGFVGGRISKSSYSSSMRFFAVGSNLLSLASFSAFNRFSWLIISLSPGLSNSGIEP
jgi:hypothetical protein